ncbi:extracellular solute-binding protein [Acholeplasma hippikon]|uniref:Glycerol-3-phosphate transporter periplasmic binding protein n=1 Tax=Acholeplasma hippikon TaxID=264636 RepID=A0A449BKP2_9MOLU|nr:extracellular solute-binding protein [Acholeplasma hippikon]VEU83046.1 glycerol-3-phosphate transporter periplasmic binding protein [Acholeplasma hippikon]
MKKIFSSLFLIALALVLVACGDQGDRTQAKAKLVEWYELSPDAEFDTTKPVTINFWHRMGSASQIIVAEWIEKFKVLYPNITVNAVKAGDDYNQLAEKIGIAIPAGTMPDIAESYPDHIARYALGDAPLALNYFISHPTLGYSEEELADFLPSLWAEGASYDQAGTILSLPFTKSSEGFFYNKTYFDQHGYEVPTTWDQVFEIAEDIKKREPNAFPFGYDSEDNLFITASKQWGAPYTGYNEQTGKGEVLFNNDQSKEMVKYFKDKVDKGLMLTRTLNGEAYTSDIFKTGSRLYMYVGSTGGTRYAYNQELFDKDMRVGVAPLPSKDGKGAQVQQGPNINLFNSGDEQRMIAAWLFAKFMISAENTAQFAIPSGYAPIRYSAYETQIWKDYVDGIKDNPTTLAEAQNKLVKEAIDMFRNNGEIFFTQAVFSQSSKARTEVGALLVSIFAYNAPNEDALNAYINSEYQKKYNFVTN